MTVATLTFHAWYRMGRRPHGAQLCVLPCPARGVARSQEYLRTLQKQLDPAENHMLRTAHTVPMRPLTHITA